MESPVSARPLSRAVRAGVFAVVCVAFAASAHLSMAAVTLPPFAALAAVAGTFGLTWILAGARRGPVGAAVWAFTAQFALHVWFERTGTAAAVPHMSMNDPVLLEGHAGAPSGMIAAHLAGGAAFTLLLRRGEAALVLVLAFFQDLPRVTFTLLRLPVPELPGRIPARTGREAPVPPRPPLAAQPLLRRGPPATAPDLRIPGPRARR